MATGGVGTPPDGPLALCRAHCSKNGCSNAACQQLHFCQRLLTGQTCAFVKCKFGHDLSTSHNRRVLLARGLYGLSPQQLGTLIAEGSASRKAVASELKVCTYYNSKKGVVLKRSVHRCTSASGISAAIVSLREGLATTRTTCLTRSPWEC